MRLGIIGLPQSGKTTVFNAITRGDRPVGQMPNGRLQHGGIAGRIAHRLAHFDRNGAAMGNLDESVEPGGSRPSERNKNESIAHRVSLDSIAADAIDAVDTPGTVVGCAAGGELGRVGATAPVVRTR